MFASGSCPLHLQGDIKTMNTQGRTHDLHMRIRWLICSAVQRFFEVREHNISRLDSDR